MDASGWLNLEYVTEEVAPGLLVTRFGRLSTWHGGPLVSLSPHTVEVATRGKETIVGDRIQVGPFSLRIVAARWPQGDYLAVRDTRFWWLWKMRFKTSLLLLPIRKLCWRTAWAWGLLDCSPGDMYPRWKWERKKDV